MPTLLYAKNIQKTFSVPKFSETRGFFKSLRRTFFRSYENKTALNQVSFEIQAGECVGLLGANGAGKTTLIKIMAGLLLPNSGEVRVLGFEPILRRPDFLRQIGLVLGQKQQLWIDISPRENFKLLKAIYQIPKIEFEKRLLDLAEYLDVRKLLDTPIRKFSLGEKMKFELIASLLHKPKLLFLDEPTIGLDVLAQNRIRNFIKDLVQKEKTTVILTSHYMKDLEELCSRGLMIQNGQLVHDGDLKNISTQNANKKRIVISTLSTNLKERLPSVPFSVQEDGQFFVEIETSEIAQFISSLHAISDIQDLLIQPIPLEEIFMNLLEKHAKA